MSDKNISLRKPPVNGKPCIRCLIDKIDDETAAGIVSEYKTATPKEEMAGEELYNKRLQVCLDCKHLVKGVCLKSGFYVEARMYRKSGCCPLKLF